MLQVGEIREEKRRQVSNFAPTCIVRMRTKRWQQTAVGLNAQKLRFLKYLLHPNTKNHV
jgi:hypothetical protein